MKTNNMPLESLTPKGEISFQINNGELHMVTLEEGLSKKQRSYVHIPDKIKLPFRIDMTLKTNSPQFKFKIGKGNIMFTGSLNRGGFGIRRVDILTGKEEQTKYDYDNVLPINEYVDLSVIYGSKMMWVEFNGKHCYCTGKASYLGLLESNAVPEEFKDGFDFEIACAAEVELTIKSLMITEYEKDEPHISEGIANMPELSSFDWYLKSLPHELRDEAIKTDEYLMKDMKSVLKFKKAIDKDGKLTYQSPCGLHYTMNRYSIGESHALYWNRFGEVLNTLAETSPEFAYRMFANINENVSGRGGEKCQQCADITCSNMKTTEYNGEKRKSCGGSMHFKWLPSDFEDVRKILAAVNEVVKISNISMKN